MCPHHSAKICILSVEEVYILVAFVSSINRDSDVIPAPPASQVSYEKVGVVGVGTLRHQPLGPLEPLDCGVGKGLGEHSGWPGSLCSLREGRALKALSWPCAPAFDLFFVFLNHTAPWVKEV